MEDGRVNGMLALSRALGDFEYKKCAANSWKDQAVTAFPEIKSMQITNDCEFLLLACDGIWDVKSSQEAVNFVHKNIYNDNFPQEKKGKTLQMLSKGLGSMFDECCAKDLHSSQGLGCDNMTAILVEIRNQDKK